MIRILLLLIISLLHFDGFSQKRYFSEKSNITFFSAGVIEEIKASNTKVTSILDILSGEIAYLLNPKDFQFEKKLMQVHFNEKYMESEKYPRSSFKGKIEGLDASNTSLQQVKAVGQLSIHGVTRDVTIPGQITRTDTGLNMTSKFVVELKDYKVEIPRLMWQNIAERVEVTLDFSLKPPAE